MATTDRPAPGAAPFVPQAYRVDEVTRVLADTVTLTLAPLEGPRPDFRPGQFNMLWAFGVGEVAISISDGEAAGSFVHTVRAVGAVSRALAELEVGARLGLRGPFGRGWPLAEARGSDVVVIAGGLGLAPLRPAIQALLANRQDYGRLVILVGARSPEALLYRDDLAAWAQRPDVEVQVTVDHAGADWPGRVGVVPGLVEPAAFDADDCVALVCGPEVMMRFTVAALRRAGVPAERIQVSMERNMKCAIGWCGHCQFGPDFVCKDGPVMRYDTIADRFAIPEV
ncbi:Ni/Fe hydrogenase subunit gamma [Billgrantia azerbaijanica]|nr:Ni/Fe hydrogenase subunit gamma [Halomonas azerbaijanica]